MAFIFLNRWGCWERVNKKNEKENRYSAK